MAHADDLNPQPRTAAEFGRWLRQLREANGLSARQLDARTRLSQSPVRLTKSQISRVESGHLPDLTWLRAFLNENGVSTGSRLYRRAEGVRDRLERERLGGVVPAETAVPTLDLDQGAYLQEKRKGFTGRAWLFAEVDTWLCKSPSERALLITGDPGVGKSAFLAEYVHRNPNGQVIAYHCCTRQDRLTLEPGAFVLSLATMLRRQLPGYRTASAESEVTRALEQARTYPGRALDKAIIGPLSLLDHRLQHPYVLLVDALDEAMLHVTPDSSTDDATIVSLLASRLDRMPNWLRIVATARRDQRTTEELSTLRAFVLETSSEANSADLAEYVAAQVAEITQVADLADTEREVLQAAHGNFLYAKSLLRDIRRGLFKMDQLSTLPIGMSGFYAKAFRQLFPTTEKTAAVHSTLEILVAAQEPLDFNLIAKASGGDRYQTATILNQLSRLSCRTEKGMLSTIHPLWTGCLTQRALYT